MYSQSSKHASFVLTMKPESWSTNGISWNQCFVSVILSLHVQIQCFWFDKLRYNLTVWNVKPIFNHERTIHVWTRILDKASSQSTACKCRHACNLNTCYSECGRRNRKVPRKCRKLMAMHACKMLFELENEKVLISKYIYKFSYLIRRMLYVITRLKILNVEMITPSELFDTNTYKNIIIKSINLLIHYVFQAFLSLFTINLKLVILSITNR